MFRFLHRRWKDYISRHRIIPFYEKGLEEPAETFLRGSALAKNFTKTEILAKSLDVRSLSSLGFSSLPLQADKMNWNTAKDGLEVFTNLHTIICDKPSEFEEVQELLEDVERILFALRCAELRSIRFTLIRKVGTVTNSRQWEQGGSGTV